MDIGSLCKREVVGIEAGEPVRNAAALMCEEHVGALVVTTGDDPPQVVGILTDRDLALEVVGRAEPAVGLRAGDLAKSPPLAVPSSATVHEAVASMESAGVRRLLVVDDDGGVVGLLSSDDLLAAIAEDLGGLSRALRQGIAREADERAVTSVPIRERPVYPGFGTAAAQ